MIPCSIQRLVPAKPFRIRVVGSALRLALCVLLAVAYCVSLSSQPVRANSAVNPPANPAHKAKLSKVFTPPNFTLTDADGKKVSLADYRGRPVALYFFCNCKWCHKYAHLWGTFQRGGALVPAHGPAPVTLVVFSDDASGAKQFAEVTGLAQTDTVLLPDMPDNLHVTDELYNAEPCPRVFVIDPSGKLVYTNNHKDDAPRLPNDDMLIASRALSALRQAEPKS